jgi:restriction system protein
VDVLARTPRGARVAVQCKHYPGRAVAPAAVREFNGCAWTDHRADVALLVTSGRFTDAAEDFGRRHRIHMVDRELLARWMAGERILPDIPAPRRGPIDISPTAGEASR